MLFRSPRSADHWSANPAQDDAGQCPALRDAGEKRRATAGVAPAGESGAAGRVGSDPSPLIAPQTTPWRVFCGRPKVAPAGESGAAGRVGSDPLIAPQTGCRGRQPLRRRTDVTADRRAVLRSADHWPANPAQDDAGQCPALRDAGEKRRATAGVAPTEEGGALARLALDGANKLGYNQDHGYDTGSL